VNPPSHRSSFRVTANHMLPVASFHCRHCGPASSSAPKRATDTVEWDEKESSDAT
jgi:hypothetical protein